MRNNVNYNRNFRFIRALPGLLIFFFVIILGISGSVAKASPAMVRGDLHFARATWEVNRVDDLLEEGTLR